MLRRIICNKRRAELEYDDKSVWEGNRDFEQVFCPICGNEVDSVFTDLIPIVRIVKKGDKYGG